MGTASWCVYIQLCSLPINIWRKDQHKPQRSWHVEGTHTHTQNTDYTLVCAYGQGWPVGGRIPTCLFLPFSLLVEWRLKYDIWFDWCHLKGGVCMYVVFLYLSCLGHLLSLPISSQFLFFFFFSCFPLSLSCLASCCFCSRGGAP